MDYYLHHLNSTVFLSSVALLLTILSYLIKNLIFCGNCCRSWSYCFKYNLPTQDQHLGYISNFENFKPIVRTNHPVTNVDLKEIIIDPVDIGYISASSPPLTASTSNKKDSYSIIQKNKVYKVAEQGKKQAFDNFCQFFGASFSDEKKMCNKSPVSVSPETQVLSSTGNSSISSTDLTHSVLSSVSVNVTTSFVLIVLVAVIVVTIFIFQYINKLHIYNLHHRISQTQFELQQQRSDSSSKIDVEEEKYCEIRDKVSGES